MSDAIDLLGERHPPDQPARVLVAEALGTNLFVSAGAGSTPGSNPFQNPLDSSGALGGG